MRRGLIACLLLLRKVGYLAKLLASDRRHTISSKVFTSVTIVDPTNVSIIQQCRMLETIVGANILDACLDSPDEAVCLVKTSKPHILHDNIKSLVSSGLDHPTAHLVAKVAGDGYTWLRLWDKALDHGSKGTKKLQQTVHNLVQPIYDNYCCPMCSQAVSSSNSWLAHLCTSHTVKLGSVTLNDHDILNLLSNEHEDIFNIIYPT